MAGFATETFQHLSHGIINMLSTPIWRFVGKNGNFQYIVNNTMLNNYFTLAYIASNLTSKLKGTRIKEIFTQDSDEVVLSLGDEKRALVISCRPQLNAIYLHSGFARARTNSVDVLKGAHGGVITAVSIHPADRIVTFRLEADLALISRFFGAKSNVLLVDAMGVIVDAFKDQKGLVGRMPAASDRGSGGRMAAVAGEASKDRSETILSIVKTTMPTLGSRLIQEALFRAGIPVTAKGAELNSEKREHLQREIDLVMEELKAPRPVVYLHRGTESPAAFSIIPLRHLSGMTERAFDDVHEAIRYFVARHRSTAALVEQKERMARLIRERWEQTRRTIEAIQNDLANNARADDHERFGSLLMANLGAMKKGMDAVEIDDGTETVRIPIDAQRSAVQNAQRYFEKAKKSRSAKHQSGKRLTELQTVAAGALQLLMTLEAVTSKEKLKEFVAEHADGLEEFGIGERSNEQEQPPFRTFTVDGGFQVWAGKSSTNNDLLTMKYAKPHDLWFHTRGSGGSHVVLKVGTGKGEPSKRAKEQAAGIAAYYSKMKNAKMVPVAMTEKKYVRKPKGASPGSVVLEREKVIFAEPRLPVEK